MKVITAEQIVARSVPYESQDGPRVCAIYFLIAEGAIQYVGRSVDCWNRFHSHRSKWWFDRISFFHCEESQLELLEIYFIWQFDPPWNGVYPRFTWTEFQAIWDMGIKIILRSHVNRRVRNGSRVPERFFR